MPVDDYIYIDGQGVLAVVGSTFANQSNFTTDNGGYALYNGKRFYYNGTLVLGTDYPSASASYWTVIDLAGTKWVLNSNLTNIGGITYYLNFSSNGNSYADLHGNASSFRYYFGTTKVYDPDNGGWTNQAYRIISITGGTDATNADLIYWLQANAIQVPVVDLTDTTWVFNDSLDINSLGNPKSKSINFTSNSNNYALLKGDRDGPSDYYFVYDNTYVWYSGGGWYDNAYKTISITGGTDATNAVLIAWLTANAKYQEPTPANTYELTHSLTNLTHGNITLQITPDTGYTYPATLTVTNGTLVSYDNTTGIAVISGDDTTVVSGECVAESSGYEVTFADSIQWNYYAQNLDTAEYSIDNGSTWVSIPDTLPLTLQANQIMLKLGYGWSGDIKPKAVCNDIGLDTGYISTSSQQTSNYTLTNNITIDLSIIFDD